jgi:pimeloyl-ACP methyl ester carboxylesterase
MNTHRTAVARSVAVAAGLVALGVAIPRVVRRRDERRGPRSELTGPELVLERHTVTSSDGSFIHVAECGSGPPVVLIHGLSLTHDLWRYQFIDLADRFRVIAYDLRGHGESTIGTDGIGPHQSAADLLAVLEQLDIDGAVVAGHSIGGTVLGQFCADHPDVARQRIGGLVFVDTFASAIAGEGRFREICSPALARVSALLAAKRKPGRTGTVSAYLAARSPFGPRPNAEHVRFTLELGANTDPSVVSLSTIANLTFDVRDALGDVDVPSLVIRGSADRLSTARSTEQLRQALAHPTVEIIQGVGHLPMLEARAEFDDLVSTFTQRTT